MRATASAATAAAVAAGCWAARRHVPGGHGRWERTNHRGERLSLLEGPSWALGALAGLAVAPTASGSVRAGAALATAGAAVFGAVDDLAERGQDKGLRGHLGALARGRVTTGGLKVLGIGGTGVASAALLLGGRRPATGPAPGPATGLATRAVEVLVAGGVVAGAANLANLLDLRPGRVLKVVALTAPALARGQAAGLVAAGLGASAALARPDLAEESMLGDCGANAAGALLGAAVVAASAGTRGAGAVRAGALAGLVLLTLASERVSFTRVIESTAGLRQLDALGRRPAPVPA